ncbi:hypothetical protein ABIA06_005394 [Bradyrhizobium yuanmingense]
MTQRVALGPGMASITSTKKLANRSDQGLLNGSGQRNLYENYSRNYATRTCILSHNGKSGGGYT